MAKKSTDRSHARSAAPLPTRLDLSPAVRTAVAGELAPRLAEALDLYHAAKHAHWNVRGPNFRSLHELFDGIAGDADEWADLLAERMRQLGVEAVGDLRAVAATSSLSAYPTGLLSEAEHLAAIADRLAAVGSAIRDSIDECDDHGDADAADICTEISRAIDKWLWMVESHLPA